MNAGIDLQFRIGDRVMHHDGTWFGRLTSLTDEGGKIYGTVILAEAIVIPADEGGPLRIHNQHVPLADLRRLDINHAVYESACAMAQELQELVDDLASIKGELPRGAAVLADWHRVNREMFGIVLIDNANIRTRHIENLSEPIPGLDDIDDQLDEAWRIKPFDQLDPYQQQCARMTFLGAEPGDGYMYELNNDGKVLCRRKG